MLKILFTNARGLTQDWRRAGFYEWIGRMGVQVVCVAEIKCPLKTTKGWHCVCHPEVKNGGVAVLVKKAPSISVERQGAANNAAFVDIAKGVTCYLETAHIKDAWFSKQCRSGKLTEGDELVVQITKEAIKTKYPIADTKDRKSVV